jgi:transcription initiation factor TFIIB
MAPYTGWSDWELIEGPSFAVDGISSLSTHLNRCRNTLVAAIRRTRTDNTSSTRVHAPIILAGLLLTALTARDGLGHWVPEQNEQERNQSTLQRAVSRLELSEAIHERTLDLLESVHDQGLMNNRAFDEMLGAIIYIAARENREPRTLDEIASATGAEKRRIGNAYRYIGRETDARVVPPPPEDFLRRFTDKLDLDDTTREEAEQLIRDARRRELLSGKSPKGVAAAALYVVANSRGERRSLKEVSDILQVTPITIRKRRDEFLDELEIELPDEIKRKD